MIDVAKIITENKKRLDKYFYEYSPVIGDCRSMVVNRQKITILGKQYYLPEEMIKKENFIISNINKIKHTKKAENEFQLIRLKYDFEFWAATCAHIQDKELSTITLLTINYGQRKIVKELEQQRLANIPIRIILDKCRQYGGSTVIQLYMLWIQLLRKEGWGSIIVTDVQQQAAVVRAMTNRVLNYYPKSVGKYTLAPYEGMQGIKQIPQRRCKIVIGSAQTPDKFRGDAAFAIHASEVGMWKSTLNKSAEAIMQSLKPIIPQMPYTIFAIESTAKGVGNFFHTEYLKAINKENNFKPIFVSWFEILMYNDFIFELNENEKKLVRDKHGLPKSAITDYSKFISSMSDYEWWQWQQGATIEGISWYRKYKRGESYSDFEMKSEFPTTWQESFQSNADKWFEESQINFARSTCMPPIKICDITADTSFGDQSLNNIKLIDKTDGEFAIWEMPEINNPKIENKYLVVVDVGGTSRKSDWSVISVYDRTTVADPFGALQVVARWRGHIHPDLLAWKAAQIACWYDNALLAIEVNTIDSKYKHEEITFDGSMHTYTVMDKITDIYDNVYMRPNTDPQNVKTGKAFKYGFNTNRNTKPAIYNEYKIALRDYRFIEKDHRAVDEMETLNHNKQENKIEAQKKCNDDIVDTNAIAIYISARMSPPVEINITNENELVLSDSLLGSPE